MPTLWTAKVMPDDAAYIRVHLSTVEVKIVNGVAQLDMIREDAVALHDVLSVALGRNPTSHIAAYVCEPE